MQTMTLTAPDISCDHCRRAIENAVGSLPGVESVAVDVDRKQVEISFEPAQVRQSMILATMADEGYPAVPS
jgi:copper chaperone